MFKRKKSREIKSGERIPIYKRSACLGEACVNFSGEKCQSRLELLEATGASGGKNLAPLKKDCSYALYGKVCMGGEKQEVVSLHAESPNGQVSVLELVGRLGQLDGQRIVLTTPSDKIVYPEDGLEVT